MALYIHPGPGDLVMCDFSGFKRPEMIKKRPVVIISPRRRRGPQLCTLVPLSTAEPKQIKICHHLLEDDSLPMRMRGNPNWAKCDMVTTVSINRLDRIYNGRDENGDRQYVIGRITDHDLLAIQSAIQSWLSLK